MSILNKLTLKNLRLNKKRTIVTIIGIILSTALMVGIGLLFSTFQDYMIKDIEEYEGRYHALYKDVSSDKLEIFDKENLEYFYSSPIGFSKIDSENEDKPYLYIEGVNKEYFNELKLIQGRFPENDSEIVISAHISSNGGASFKVGDELTLDYGYRVQDGDKVLDNNEYVEGEELVINGSKRYKVVGIVARSNYESYSASGYSVFTLDENTSNNIDVYAVFDKKSKIIKQAKEIASEIDYDEKEISYNAQLLALYGESTYSNIMSTMIGMLSIMLCLVSIGCIIVIYNSFAISVMERKKEFGLLSSVGTTKRQLSHMVFFEALIEGTIGIILGIIGAYIGIGVVVAVINNLIGDILDYKLCLTTNIVFIIIPVIFMIVVILISAIIPSKRAARVSPIEAIRQNDDIKINKKKIRTSKLVNKLFGVEGEIALKNIKRNKKKYRVTIISLFISIVLFISFSAYMNYTLGTADDVIGSYDYDINVSIYDSNPEIDDKVSELLANSNISKYISYETSSIPIRRTVTYTDDYKKFSLSRFGEEYYNEIANMKYDNIDVIILDDNSYEKYKREIGLNEDKVILFNNYKGVTYTDGKRTNYNVDVISNDTVTLNMCNFGDMEDIPLDITPYCTKNVNNVFITNKEYGLFGEISNMDSYKLIVNDKIYKTITDINKYDIKVINIVSDNTNELDKLGEKLNEYPNVSYINIEEEMKMGNNLILAIKILMYGFISLVTLIGVTSVFNTISTSMALRKKEFAILRSIGLTRKGFNKILFFESLFFGLKSLLYALPVSFGVIILIHLSMSNMISTSGILIPWNSILLSIVMVFVIVLLTMLYSASKIKKQNILEQIREENI